jgi:hypothetical protein
LAFALGAFFADFLADFLAFLPAFFFGPTYHHTLMLMEAPPIDSIGRLQIGCQQAVIPLQALNHRAHIVAILHGAMVRHHG